MKKFKALSLKQPWADLVASGLKTIETRRWKTNYRGPLLICASKSIDHASFEGLRKFGKVFPRVPKLPRGVAVCLVDLKGCELMNRYHEHAACCEAYSGAWAWHIGNLRRLIAPLPEVKGQLRLFNVELERVVFENAT